MLCSIRNVIILFNKGEGLPEGNGRLASILPLLDVHSDIYVVADDFPEEPGPVIDTMKQIAAFLSQQHFYRINLHPLHGFTSAPLLVERYHQFHQLTLSFMEEAYRNQSVSRFMIFPAIRLGQADQQKEVAPFLAFLRARNLTPGIYLHEADPSAFSGLMNTQQERIYVELGEGTPAERVVRTLGYHFQCDALLSWVHDPIKADLPGDRTVILSGNHRKVFVGLNRFFTGEAIDAGSPSLLSEIEAFLRNRHDDDLQYNLEVITALKETLRINNRQRETANIFFNLGLALVKREDYALALKQFEEALATPHGIGEHRTVLVFKGLCLLRLHDLKEAQAALDAVEREDPTNALVHYYQGHLEFEFKDYIEAIDRFKKALEIDPDQVPEGDAYYFMALSHINILEYDDALVCLDEAEKRYAQNKLSPIFYYRGVCLVGKNELDAAYQFFQKALEADPAPEDLGSIYLYRGICHKEKGNYRDALEELKKARQAEENRLEIYNLMGFCYFKLKAHDQAIECFVKAVEIDPRSAIDWANLGVNVRAKGEDEKAILLFKKALSLDPTIGFAHKHLNELLGQKDK